MFRRWLAGIALGGAVAVAAAGCGTPTGTDGDLVDEWPTIGTPVAFTPEAGTCHPHPQDVGYLSSYAPVGCDQPHRVETLHVGTLTGGPAGGATPPAPGSAGMRAAWGECHRAVTKALGADWRGGRISLAVVFPSPRAWTGGSRWFRCDVNEVRTLDDPGIVLRTASLKGTLTGTSPLLHRCFNPKIKNDRVTEMAPVACTKKHHAEFVGVWQAPKTSFAAFRKDDKASHRACLKLIARFVKVPDNSDMKYRSGTIYYQPHEEDWRNGERGVQCFLWLDGRNLTRSLKGAGTRGLPIN